jgi:UDP-N-acetylmuramate--alanine ligase
MGFAPLIKGKQLFFLGIKGTGMASLAVCMQRAGARVSGVDSTEVFATDAILQAEGIAWIPWEAFDFVPEADMIIHSSAFSVHTFSQFRSAKTKGLPIYSYPEFLAYLSKHSDCYGIAGTHGKTTSTGCASHILAPTGLPVYSLFGASLQQATKSVRLQGDSIGLMEACEYQDHFLLYQLKGLLVTNIEHDHPDYFPNVQAVFESFQRLVSQLPPTAFLVCGSDSEMSWSLACWAQSQFPDMLVITYGQRADSTFRLTSYDGSIGGSSYRLSPLQGDFYCRLVGVSLCSDVIGASILGACVVHQQTGDLSLPLLLSDPVLPALLQEAASFSGCSGRLELMEEAGGILFFDDYAHHPTEIEASIDSLRQLYPAKRLVLVFSPHTQSRTQRFFDGFVEALSLADVLVVQEIYASARRDGDGDSGNSLTIQLAQQAGGMFACDLESAIQLLLQQLQEDDLCITMGAGNNRGLSAYLAGLIRRNACRA